jgi:hypothetical protein
MKVKLLLLVSLCLIATLIYVSEKSPWWKEEASVFPRMMESTPSKIEIKRKGEVITLERRGGEWVVTTSGGYPADEAEIEEILTKVKEFRRERIVSRNPKKRSVFHVDKKEGIEVKILGSDTSTLAHFYVGKSGPDYMSTYIREKGCDEVLLVDGYLRADFGKESGRWRDRTIFDFDHTRVEKLVLKLKEEDKIVISRDEEGNWLIEEPIEAEADKEKVERLLQNFSSLNCSDFAEGVDLKKCGLEEGEEKIVAYLQGGESKELLFGGETEQGERYVRREDKDTVFLLSKYRAKNLLKNIEELKKK